MKIGDRVIVLSGDLKDGHGVITHDFLSDPIPCILIILDEYPHMELYFQPQELEVI